MALSKLAQYVSSKIEFHSNVALEFIDKNVTVTEDSSFIYINGQVTMPQQFYTEGEYSTYSSFNESITRSQVSEDNASNFITSNTTLQAGVASLNKKANLILGTLNMNESTRTMQFVIKIPKNILELHDSIWMSFAVIFNYTGSRQQVILGVKFVDYDPINAKIPKIRLSDPEFFNQVPINTTIPNQSTQMGTNKTVNLSTYFSDANGDALTYTASSSNTAIGTVAVSGSTLTLTPKAVGTATITVTANDGKGGTKSTTFTFSVTNSTPIVTLTSPIANQTLYEDDTITISGTANDSNSGDVVTVRYQINALSPVAILPFVADGTAKSFTRQLRFTGGNLYDGDTLIVAGLTEGTPQTLKVYATDDKNGQSTIVERNFYVVPNRVPLLTVNQPVISGNIDTDKIQFNGGYSDPDNNACTMSYKINGGNSVQVASGTSGNWNFEITFGQLKEGLNNIVIEVIDSYGAKTSRTVKLQKNEVKTEQLKSTARYKIKPPMNTATGIVVWVQRDEGLTLSAAISMHNTGEAENFVAMTKTKTAPMPNSPGIVEDQFQFENVTAIDNVILQLDFERSSIEANEKIHAIVGVID